MDILFYSLLILPFLLLFFCGCIFLLREAAFKLIALFSHEKAFNLRLKYADSYKYYGLEHGGIHLPQARVLYSDGKVSRNMPIGNAKDYAGIFKGKVIMPN